MSDVRYRWIDGPTATEEEWQRIDDVLANRGWASLNRQTTRILVAERGNEFAFHIFQLVPYCGPLYLPRSMRGTGIAEELADQMMAFLVENNARGWLVTAESPHAAKLCENRGMMRVPYPTYVMPDLGGVEV